jgi:rubrerythrin
MSNEQDKAYEALKYAIQMEIDGKEHYLKASMESRNELGQKLLRKLAEEEDYHRRKFELIYETIQKKKSWPAVDFEPNSGRALRTIFARAIEDMDSEVKPLDTELQAVKMAMELENESRDYYTTQAEKATEDGEREFYEQVAMEEREHHLVLMDYYDFLQDPAGWFTQKEHPSLDG